MAKRLNVGAGQNFPTPSNEWINIDKFPVGADVIKWDVDETPITAAWYDLDEIRCWGNLGEFKHTVVEMMNMFWDALQNGGTLDVIVAVVDKGLGCFRDPSARRYLHSEWVEYFIRGGRWETGGHGLGFIGEFEVVSNELLGERHHVILRAVKHG